MSDLYHTKILNRFHYTVQRLTKMGLTSNISTNYTLNTPDTYMHSFWHRLPIQQFWKKSHKITFSFSGQPYPLNPLTMLETHLRQNGINKITNYF